MPRPLPAIPASGQFLSRFTFSGSETQLGHPLLQDALAHLPEGPSDFSEPPQPQVALSHPPKLTSPSTPIWPGPPVLAECAKS